MIIAKSHQLHPFVLDHLPLASTAYRPSMTHCRTTARSSLLCHAIGILLAVFTFLLYIVLSLLIPPPPCFSCTHLCIATCGLCAIVPMLCSCHHHQPPFTPGPCHLLYITPPLVLHHVMLSIYLTHVPLPPYL